MPPNQRDPVAPATPGSDRQILSVAAVIGDEFEIPILAAAAGLPREQIQPHLNELERGGFVQRIDDDNYRFVDATARRGIYDELGSGLRSRLHWQIGEAIEKLYGVDSDERIEELARHFSQGITPAITRRAIDCVIRAGEKVQKTKAYRRAGSYWRTALKMIPGASDMADLHAKALLLLNDELVSTGPEAVAYLEQALASLESLKWKSWIGYAHSRLGYFFSAPITGAELNLPRAMALFDRAEALLQAHKDRGKLAEMLQYKCGACNLSMQSTLGLETGCRGMELCDQIGDGFRWIQTATLSTRHLVALGKLSEASALVQKAFKKAEEFDDPYSGSMAAWMGGLICSDVLDFTGALDWYLAEERRPRTAQSLSRTQALQTEIAHMYEFMGELGKAREVLEKIRGPGASVVLPLQDGEWDRSAFDMVEKLKLARSTGYIDSISLRVHWLGNLYHFAGKIQEAEQLQLEGLTIARAAPNFPRVILAAQELCLIYYDMDRREDAARMLHECQSILARGEDWRGSEGTVLRARAVVSAMHRRFLNADAEFERAIDIHRRYQNGFIEADAFLYWGRALIAAGDRKRANEKLERSIEVYRRMGAGQPFIDRVELFRARLGVPAIAPMELVSHASTECSFAREGAIWTISHRHRTFRIKDMKGLRYIAHLLEHPGEEFHVLDLVTAIDGAANATASSPSEDLRIANDLGDAGEILDRRSKSEYRNRRDELRADLNDAEVANDRGRTQRIRAELEMLDEQLASAMGLGGRDRKTGDHSERARDRIRKSIHKSLESIRENDPSLGHYLTTCIRTGYLCSYQPDPASR